MRGRHRRRSKAPRRFLRGASGLAALVLSLGSVAVGISQAADSVADSAVTVSGTGEFSNLKVTVSQTKNLIAQVVKVSWTGGAPTDPVSGNYDRNYLQMMQCWGDPETGPTREQCQFGGLTGDTRGGSWVASRQVTYTDVFTDPKETIKKPEGSLETLNVPFKSVTGKTITTGANEFFDGYSTNEIPFGRTRPDGTGQEFFEIQSSREAPGLGCGEKLTAADGSIKGRPCFLVVIPRGQTEIDGSIRDGGAHMDSSPLSQSNWDKRIVVPLDFQPIGQTCELGKDERPTLGQELVAEAVFRWQPTLCAKTDAVYGYSQVSDSTARRQLLAAEPGMAFLSNKLAADQVPSKGPAVYAPVGVSGLVFAYNIERQSSSAAPAKVKALNGERITDLKLSPRLIAKLLTMSYRSAVLQADTLPATNPTDLTRDKEFLELNPEFKKLFFVGIPDVLLPIGLADSTSQLWTWLKSDPDAGAFLAGKADPYGMTVNPNFKNLESPLYEYPKRDPKCRQFENQPELCIYDARPYAADMHEGARSAGRGDSLARGVWDPTAQPPSYKKAPPQLSGTRSLIALTDVATAERYSLPIAQVKNAKGEFVTPTTASLTAAVDAVSGFGLTTTPQPNPSAKVAGAYPLTSISYAATVPQALDQGARDDYATLLKYAIGDGQKPGLDIGDLPAGYAPLPSKLVDAAKKTIAEIEKPTLKAAAAESSGEGETTGGGDNGSSTGSTDNGGVVQLPTSDSSTPAVNDVPVVPTVDLNNAPLNPDPQVRRAIVASTVIPAAGSGIARYMVLGAFALGAAAVVAGPSLQFLARRRGATAPEL